MNRAAVLILCLALPQIGLASTERVYRWTDADGVVHYSQTEPAKIKAEVRDVRTAKPQAAQPAQPTQPVASAPNPGDEEACTQARANAELLAGTQPLSMDKDGDGKPDPLSDEDRKATIAETERQVSSFCKGT